MLTVILYVLAGIAGTGLGGVLVFVGIILYANHLVKQVNEMELEGSW